MPLINKLIKDGYLYTTAIIKAFKHVKRVDFIPDYEKNFAEDNRPLTIGYGQTNSQPLTVAFMFELLQPQLGDKILDIGCGSGWTTALLASIVKTGKIYGLEIISELADIAEKNIGKYNFIKYGTVQIFCSDGYLGLPEAAPFNKILVSAASREIPGNLLEQLKNGGRMVIPIGRPSETQDIVLIKKIDNYNYKVKKYPGFIFVPLVNK